MSSEFKAYEGNLSNAHKRIKAADKANRYEDARMHLAAGFLHVFIELTAQARDYVKYQTKESD